MIIKSAEFLVSNPDYTKGPDDGKPEYAFIGRSNVGKSSLINMLTNRNKLAMTSSTPGKTMLINHFVINDKWYLVDLPGYGYAKRGKEAIARIEEIINNYILNREQLTCLFVLIDSRHKPQLIDLEFIEWLGENEIPFSIVFTKTDKLSAARLHDNMKNYKELLAKSWSELPPLFYTSSEKRTGGEEILKYIEQINKTIEQK